MGNLRFERILLKLGGEALAGPSGFGIDPASAAYCKTVMAMPEMQEWVRAARAEPEDIEELDMDF